MTTRATLATTALAVVALLTLAACGSETTASSANITFKSDPAAAVWIDGDHRGTTPIVIAVEAGKHEVVLKAPGFKDEKGELEVVAGTDLTVETGLSIDGTSVEAYKRLLAALDVEHEDFDDVEVHRGVGDQPVMLYWPQKDVRKAGLSTYRLEVTPDYENDGYIEFRKGSKVLHREKFEAESLVTERALPTEVIEALKRGGSYTWGIYFEENRRKPVTAKFKVVDGRKVERRLAKLMRRQTYRRANALMREMAKIDVLRNYRLYAETLSHSLRVLNTWPDTQMPFQSIHFALQRLDLKDTQLYQAVAGALLGNGVSARRPDLGDTNRDSAKGGQTSSLPPSLVAPRVRDDKAAGLQPGGMGVTPTPDAQKQAPGPVTPEGGGDAPSDDGVRVDPRTERPGDVAARLAEAETNAAEARAAEDGLRDAREAAETAHTAQEAAQAALESAQQAAEAADKAVQDLTDAGAPQAQIDAAEAAAEAARNALTEAVDRLKDAQEDAELTRKGLEEAEELTKKVLEQTGSADEAQKALDDLRKAIESGPLPALPGTTDQPKVLPGQPSESHPDDGTGPVPQASPADILEQARQNLESTEAWLRDLGDRQADAETAYGQADKALQDAEAALGTLEASGSATPAQIEAAQAAVEQAAAEFARAEIEKERIAGELRVAEQTRGEAAEEVSKAEAAQAASGK